MIKTYGAKEEEQTVSPQPPPSPSPTIIGESEIILNVPRFLPNNADKAIRIILYLMQRSFKTFVETFKDYIRDYADLLKEWQDNYNKLIVRYVD